MILIYSFRNTSIIMLFVAFIDYLFPLDKSKLIKTDKYTTALTFFNVYLLSIFENLILYEIVNPFKLYWDINKYGLGWLIISGIMYVIITDFLLWFQHYLLHIPFLYKHFHHYHHKFINPTAFDFAAIHPIELIFIYMTFHIVPIFINVHFMIIYLYELIINMLAVLMHGNGLKLISKLNYYDDEYHNIHHNLHFYNYGVGILSSFWDWLFGTLYKKLIR